MTEIRFWFSEIQRRTNIQCDRLMGEGLTHRNFVTLLVGGNPVEVQYTECCSDATCYPANKTNFKDALFLGSAPDYSTTRIETDLIENAVAAGEEA